MVCLACPRFRQPRSHRTGPPATRSAATILLALQKRVRMGGPLFLLLVSSARLDPLRAGPLVGLIGESGAGRAAGLDFSSQFREDTLTSVSAIIPEFSNQSKSAKAERAGLSQRMIIPQLETFFPRWLSRTLSLRWSSPARLPAWKAAPGLPSGWGN